MQFGPNYFVSAGENFFLTRQIKYNTTHSWQPWNFQYSYYYTSYVESLYYLALNTKSIPVFNRSIQGDQAWIHSDIVTNSSGTFLYEEMIQSKYSSSYYGSLVSSNRIVNVSEITKEMGYFNLQHNGSYTAEVRNGKLLICPPGCSDCNCTSCLSGFRYDNETGICVKCRTGCSSCSNSSTCLSCFEGHHYNYSTPICA